MAKAAVYARISSDRDGERLGVRRQIEDGRRICAERGWEPVEYVDNSITAADPKITRPEYERMVDDVRAGALAAVVCWDSTGSPANRPSLSSSSRSPTLLGSDISSP